MLLMRGATSGQAVTRQQGIPKYLQQIVAFARHSDLTDEDRNDLLRQVRRARRQVERLGQGGAPNQALKTAYSELLDAVVNGSEKALSRSVHTAAEEKSRYVAERIARTEAARAWADGFAEKYMDDDSVVAFQWKLASRHPKFDICDLYADANLYGLGKGIYPKNATPRLPVHPHCLCHLAPVYRSELKGKKAVDQLEEGGRAWLEKQSLYHRQQILGIQGTKAFANRDSWTKWARNYSPEVMRAPNKPRLINAYEEFMRKATPGAGNLIYEEGYRESRHNEEIRVAEWLHNTLGGNIEVLNEKTRFKVKSPDYLWNGKMWDLKTLESVKAADSAIRHGVKQIKNNPGGLILHFHDSQIDLQGLSTIILSRLRRSTSSDLDIIVMQEMTLKQIFHFKANK